MHPKAPRAIKARIELNDVLNYRHEIYIIMLALTYSMSSN